MTDRKSIEIELFGCNLILAERDAVDVLALNELVNKNIAEKESYKFDLAFELTYMASIVTSSLKKNIKQVPDAPEKYNWFDKLIKTKRFTNYAKINDEIKQNTEFNAKLEKLYLLEHLSISQLNELGLKVLKLEGATVQNTDDKSDDNDKKKAF